MNRNALSVATLSIISLVTFVVAFRARTAAREAQNASVRYMEQLEHWKSATRAMAEERESVEKQLVVLRAKREMPAAAQKPRVSLRNLTAKETPSVDAMLNEPALQLLYLKQRKADVRLAYEPFIRRERLSETQADKLVEAIVAFETHLQDLKAIRQLEGLSSSDLALRSNRRDALAERQAATKALLGEQGVAALQAYERTLPVREGVAKYAGTASLAGLTLSSEQGEQLTELIANESNTQAMYGNAKLLLKIDWDAVERALPNVLSRDQLELFHQANTVRWKTEYDRTTLPAVTSDR